MNTRTAARAGMALVTASLIAAAAAAGGSTTDLQLVAEEVTGSATPSSSPTTSDTPTAAATGSTTATASTTATTSASASGTPSATPSAVETTPASSTPTPTPTDPPAQVIAAVSIAANVQRITSGNAPILYGWVTDTNGQPVSGASVELLGQTYGQTAYQPFATVTGGSITTNSEGFWQAPVRPIRQTGFVARVEGVQSRTLVVFVSARVNLDRSQANRTVQPSYAFVGNLDPDAPDFRGAAVGLGRLTSDARGRQVFAVINQTRTATDAAATFRLPGRGGALPPGTATYVVFTSARNGLLKGSASVRLNVAGPPPPAPPPSSRPANPGDNVNCDDFDTQAQAQAYFNRYYPYYGDVANLDADNDRVACESLP